MSVKFSDIISQYDGSSDFIEWVDKIELVAKLQKVSNLENFIPLFLTGSAYNVYKSISESDRKDYNTVKSILIDKFCSDSCMAYEELIRRRFLPGETVESYFADVDRLAKLIDHTISTAFIKSAFLAGLPNDVKEKVRSSNDVIALSLQEVMQRAKSIVKSGEICNAAYSSNNKFNDSYTNHKQNKEIVCFNCQRKGHVSRYCQQRFCFVCGSKEHMASGCTKKFVAKND